MNQILLNNQIYHPASDDLPCLIHGKPQQGSSLFSVSLIADLYAQKKKILFLCGYPMAREEFIQQTGADTDSENDVQSQVLFVLKEDVHDFFRLLQTLPDIDDRIIVVKNVDLFDRGVWDAVHDKQRLIVSGDLDECSFGDVLLSHPFSTRIFFSKPVAQKGETLPQLEKYTGYLRTKNTEGAVTVREQ